MVYEVSLDKNASVEIEVVGADPAPFFSDIELNQYPKSKAFQEQDDQKHKQRRESSSPYSIEEGKNRSVSDPQLSIPVVIVTLFAALGGFLFGYDTGVISGVKGYDSFLEYFNHPSDVMISLVVSAVLIGAIIGCLFGGPICDKMGRRPSLIISGAIFTVGAVVMGAAVSIAMLIVGRFIVGVGIGIASLAVPLYVAELAPAHLRGALGTVNQLFITIGIVVAYGINIGFTKTIHGWAYPLGLSGAPALVLFLGMFLLPESPYWLVMHNREEEALEVLQTMRGKNVDISAEMADMRDSAAIAMMQENSRWREILVPKIFRVLAVGFGLTSLQQFVGINAVIYYAPEIFKSVGGGTGSSDLISTLIVGLVNVFMTVVSLFLVDRLGRKTLLIIGSSLMASSMLVISILAALNLFATKPALGYVTIIAICLFISGFAVSWGAIAWIIPSETFPLRLRGKMITISTFGNWISNFVVSMSFLPLYNAIGWGTFLIFCCIEVLSLIFVIVWVPETKGKSIDELTAGL